ncbi:accessory Sec system S-layer assembly protein [Gracilibacillus ureilyticus]|uniref:Accessory Sec system S-layer assembly protein n=1 Tax=Gracilibacillus ureilyticus TaxID=531814 RepID=A0A1H9RBL7_9BACI|nr:accessory Sec system S-layer assembly protein [Gracilibacillus ureilyticus]SER70104.1 accessory Sec system S-layer assembly protein [Gracilibacillus ureilyticus]
MFPFLDRKKNKVSRNEQEVSAADVLGNEIDTDGSNDELVETILSIHPSWNLPEEEKYVFAFHNNEAKALKPNQLSITTVDLEERKHEYQFIVLIRHSVNKAINLGEASIVLLDEEKRTVIKKKFNLSNAGKLPPKSSRPWKFSFTKKELSKLDAEPNDNWSIAFELKRKHQLDLEESWKQSLAQESIEQLEKIVSSAKPLKPGEVNFMGIEAKFLDDNQLSVTILIRNGAERDLNIEKLPIMITDASGEVIAKGGFQFDKLTIKANTSKPWRFIFPSSLILKEKENIDLSKWQAQVIQK